jgi:hypothetical protein
MYLFNVCHNVNYNLVDSSLQLHFILNICWCQIILCIIVLHLSDKKLKTHLIFCLWGHEVFSFKSSEKMHENVFSGISRLGWTVMIAGVCTEHLLPAFSWFGNFQFLYLFKIWSISPLLSFKCLRSIRMLKFCSNFKSKCYFSENT